MKREKEIEKELALLDGPPRFDVEISLKCNVHCAMCPRDKITRPKRIMFPRVMDMLIKWLPHNGEVYICGLGEPLLNSGIYGFITKLSKRDIRNGITTNGLLLGPDTIHRLTVAGIGFIHVSFPSLNKATYERMMNGSSFEKVMTHLTFLSKVKPDGLDVELAFTEQEENAGEVEEVKAFAQDLGFGFQHNILHSRGGHFKHRYKTGQRGGLMTCAVFARNHFITCQGDILACCHDLEGTTRIGNIEDVSFCGMLEIKKSRISNNRWFPICHRCDDISRFRAGL